MLVGGGKSRHGARVGQNDPAFHTIDIHGSDVILSSVYTTLLYDKAGGLKGEHRRPHGKTAEVDFC